MVKNDEIKTIFDMFGDYWSLLKCVWDWEDSDAYWEKLVKYVGAFAKKYENVRDEKGIVLRGYSKALGEALLEEIEERAKGKAD
jgi:hypothetical protein